MWKKLNKQTATYFFIFLLTVFSGAIRKWVIINTTVGNLLFLIQLVSLFFFGFKHGAGVNKVFKHKLLTVYLIYLIIIAFNPLNKTVYHGLFGIILHFGFWFACFYYIEHREKFNFDFIIGAIVAIAFGEVFLAFIQYSLPQDNFLNRYADEKQVGGNIAVVGSAQAVRVTGTFSYISGFSAYILFHAYFVWTLIKKQYRPYITVTLMFFGLIVAFMNGSRGATYVYIMIMGFFLVFEARNSNLSSFLPRLIVPGLIIYLIVLARGEVGIESNVTAAYDNFQERRETLAETGEEKTRLFGDYYILRDFRGKYPIFGIGLGATYQGNQTMFGTSEYLIEYGFVESEMVRIVVEGGFVLLVFRLILAIYFCSLLSVNTAAKIFIGVLFFLTPTVFNIYNSIFTFLGVAMLDQVYYLDKIRRRRMINNVERETYLHWTKRHPEHEALPADAAGEGH